MVEKDRTLVKLAEMGDAISQRELGDEYLWDKEYTKAEFWYKRSAEQGDLFAYKSLGILYAEINKLSEAVYWWEKAAKEGDVQAQFEMGRIYEHGEGVSRDRSTAISWWTKAAEQEHEIAEYYLGCYYKDMYIFTKDSEMKSKGLYWLKRAVEHGYSKAQFVYFMLMFYN